MSAPSDESNPSAMDNSLAALDELANTSIADSASALRAYFVPTASEPVTDYRPWMIAAVTAKRPSD